MDLTAIQAVFFDAVGTLLHPWPPASEVYAAVGRRHGSCLTPDAIAKRFRTAFQREEDADLAANLRTSEERELRRWRTIVAAVLDDVTDSEGCFQELFRHFSRPDAWQCDPDAAEVLPALAARGLGLGLASNYDHRLRSVVAGWPALASVPHLVISAEVGWRKPAPEFFAAVCTRAGVEPKHLLLVGDDRDNDYEGALAFGCQAVLFDPHERATDPVRRIRTLRELLDAG